MPISSWVLCGPDGPSGGFALATAHVKGKTLLCSHSPNDVSPEPQRNESIAAVRGAVHPSKKGKTMFLTYFILVDSSNIARVHLSFSGCRIYFVAFILVLIQNPIGKQCTP